MSLSALYRIAAVALIVGGLAGTVAGFLQPGGNDPKAVVASTLFYLRQRSESGVLGLIVVGILLAAGGVLVGVATIRARVFTRWVGIALMVAAVLNIVLGFAPLPGVLGNVSGALMDLVLAWFGVELWASVSGEQQAVGQAEPPLSAQPG